MILQGQDKPDDCHQEPRQPFATQDHVNRLLERVDFRLDVTLLEILLQLELVQRLRVGRDVYQGVARLLGYRAHFLSAVTPHQEENFLTICEKRSV